MFGWRGWRLPIIMGVLHPRRWMSTMASARAMVTWKITKMIRVVTRRLTLQTICPRRIKYVWRQRWSVSPLLSYKRQLWSTGEGNFSGSLNQFKSDTRIWCFALSTNQSEEKGAFKWNLDLIWLGWCFVELEYFEWSEPGLLEGGVFYFCPLYLQINQSKPSNRWTFSSFWLVDH